MELHLTAFPRDGRIPKAFTADGEDRSPFLEWTALPATAKALVLIVEDPDAPVGLWTHWTVYNIPVTSNRLPEGQPQARILMDGSRQGKNTWGRLGYNGPSPPPGAPHRYFFRLFALTAPLALEAGALRHQLDAAMEGKIIEEAHWMGTYGR